MRFSDWMIKFDENLKTTNFEIRIESDTLNIQKFIYVNLTQTIQLKSDKYEYLLSMIQRLNQYRQTLIENIRKRRIVHRSLDTITRSERAQEKDLKEQKKIEMLTFRQSSKILLFIK